MVETGRKREKGLISRSTRTNGEIRRMQIYLQIGSSTNCRIHFFSDDVSALSFRWAILIAKRRGVVNLLKKVFGGASGRYFCFCC